MRFESSGSRSLGLPGNAGSLADVFIGLFDESVDEGLIESADEAREDTHDAGVTRAEPFREISPNLLLNVFDNILLLLWSSAELPLTDSAEQVSFAVSTNESLFASFV